ncbi:MAG: amidohydrolase [Bacteroidetes bacterium HGW-Bacteroidetes-2]|nr:MAG: amidohydrolase [Bacteroidetes bacterium HGW-Bacteroidetes-2]
MKIIPKKLPLIVLFLISMHINAQQTPALLQKNAITIQGATAHIGNGSVLENCTIVFENGKITAIGNVSTQVKGTIINASGKHVYPGFIVTNSTLGLAEIDAVRASVDVNEIGSMIPNVRSLIAYNAESKIVESMRPNGVLIGQIVPRGGRITGTSSVVQFDAWNWEDAVIKTDDAIHLNWPNSFSRGRWWEGESRAYSPNKNYEEEILKVSYFLKDAFAYGKIIQKEKNLAFQAVQGLFTGKQKLFINADGEKEIIDAITFAKEIGIKEVVLVGGYDAYKITEFLKQNNVSVIAGRTQSTPIFEDDDYDLPYKMPKLLADAGILVALNPDGRMERMNTRNLPFYAGQVVGQGMDKEEALKMITSNAAKILGIDNDYGTLEIGKSATLFISEGDALDARTNLVSKAFIDGREISLNSHHTTLYQRYSEKYEMQKQ